MNINIGIEILFLDVVGPITHQGWADKLSYREYIRLCIEKATSNIKAPVWTVFFLIRKNIYKILKEKKMDKILIKKFTGDTNKKFLKNGSTVRVYIIIG